MSAKIQQAIALIRGGLNSLAFAAPEVAHLHYERFEDAAKLLESLSQPETIPAPPGDGEPGRAEWASTIDSAGGVGKWSCNLEPFERFNRATCGWMDTLRGLGYKVDVTGRGKSMAFVVSWGGAK